MNHVMSINLTSQMYRGPQCRYSTQLRAYSNSGDQALSPPSLSGLKMSYIQHLDIT